MAVEPRKIKQPTDTKTAAVAEAGVGASSAVSEELGAKKKFPMIPVLAGLVALIVLGLLGKVVLSK